MKSANISPHRISGYLAATATLGTLASSAGAAIVQLDVSSISGPNGGVEEGPNKFSGVDLKTLSPSAPDGLIVLVNIDGSENGSRLQGILGYEAMEFAHAGAIAEPKNFSSTDIISATAFTSGNMVSSLFQYSNKYGTFTSADFESGSFMGFRVDELDGNDKPTGDYYYGWLEVTWKAADQEFYILSGAVNTTLNESITAGNAGVSAIPEPSSALGTLGLLAAGMMIRRRGKKAA